MADGTYCSRAQSVICCDPSCTDVKVDKELLCLLHYGMVWYGMVWYGMVWYGMVWYGMVCYVMVWYGLVWYGIV